MADLDDGFYVEFPVRLIVVGADQESPDRITFSGLVYADVDGRKCIAIYTDDDLAERAVQRCGIEGCTVAAIAEPSDLIRLLRAEKLNGASHVAFDPPELGARQIRMAEIDMAIGILEKIPPQ